MMVDGVTPGRERPEKQVGAAASPAETWRAGRFQRYYTTLNAIYHTKRKLPLKMCRPRCLYPPP